MRGSTDGENCVGVYLGRSESTTFTSDMTAFILA
jgi:hypothetical protein